MLYNALMPKMLTNWRREKIGTVLSFICVRLLLICIGPLVGTGQTLVAFTDGKSGRAAIEQQDIMAATEDRSDTTKSGS